MYSPQLFTMDTNVYAITFPGNFLLGILLFTLILNFVVTYFLPWFVTDNVIAVALVLWNVQSAQVENYICYVLCIPSFFLFWTMILRLLLLVHSRNDILVNKSAQKGNDRWLAEVLFWFKANFWFMSHLSDFSLFDNVIILFNS